VPVTLLKAGVRGVQRKTPLIGRVQRGAVGPDEFVKAARITKPLTGHSEGRVRGEFLNELKLRAGATTISSRATRCWWTVQAAEKWTSSISRERDSRVRAASLPGRRQSHGSMFHGRPARSERPSYPFAVWPGPVWRAHGHAAGWTVRNLEIIDVNAEETCW